MTSIPVSYGSAELLKVNVTFNYDRYVVNPGTYSGSKSNAKPIQKLNDVLAYADDTGRSIEDARTLASGGTIETIIE